MTPGARLGAAIEILDRIFSGAAAEQELTGWARRSRFAGSKDRAAVRDMVFDVLRARQTCAALGGGHDGRSAMLGWCRRQGEDPTGYFGADQYAPKALSKEEHEVRISCDASIWDVPDWQVSLFDESHGSAAFALARSLAERAPVFLRVNVRKATLAEAEALLAQDDIAATPVAGVATALRVTQNPRRVAQSAAYQQGVVEIQDAASQAVCLNLPVPKGGRVLDLCAGGGGKVLAVAAQAEAQYVASDVDPARMGDIAARAERAGVTIATMDKAAALGVGPYDLVICDVPCSGSGAWRRNPAGKWDLTPERLAALRETQLQILSEAAGCVAANGVIAYMTCSIFNVENQQIVEDFLRNTSMFSVMETRHWLPGSEGDGMFRALLRSKA